MYTESIDQANIALKRRQKTFRMLGAFLAVLSLFLWVISFLEIFYTLTSDDFIAVSVISVIFTLGGGLLFVIGGSSASTKIIYKEMLPNIAKELTFESDITLKPNYKDKHFTEAGGLFSGYNTTHIRYSVSHPNFKFGHIILAHSNGKSQTVDFDGLYYVFPLVSDQVQIRTNGKPHKKGVKYYRHEQVELRYYSTSEMGYVDQSMISLFEHIKREYQPKKLYLATTGTELHIAVTGKVSKFPKFKTVTYKEWQLTKDWLKRQLDLGLDLLSIISNK